MEMRSTSRGRGGRSGRCRARNAPCRTRAGDRTPAGSEKAGRTQRAGRRQARFVRPAWAPPGAPSAGARTAPFPSCARLARLPWVPAKVTLPRSPRQTARALAFQAHPLRRAENLFQPPYRKGERDHHQHQLHPLLSRRVAGPSGHAHPLARVEVHPVVPGNMITNQSSFASSQNRTFPM